MSEQILIEFAARALDAAKAITKEVLSDLKGAAKSIGDVEKRREFLAFVKDKAKERKDELKAEERLAARAKDVRDQRASDLATVKPLVDAAAAAAVTKALGFGARLAHLGGGVVNVLTQDADPNKSKNLQLGLHALAATQIPIASQVASILSQVVSLLDAQEEKIATRLEKQFQEQVQQHLAAANTTKRFQDDPQFRSRIEQQAQSRYLSDVAGGWEPRASRLLDGDF